MAAGCTGDGVACVRQQRHASLHMLVVPPGSGLISESESEAGSCARLFWSSGSSEDEPTSSGAEHSASDIGLEHTGGWVEESFDGEDLDSDCYL